jgi:hypothetical protein
MVLKFVTKNGVRVHGPPYTKAEEDDFYRRWNSGPLTVYRSSDERKAPTSQEPQPPDNRVNRDPRRNDSGSGVS